MGMGGGLPPPPSQFGSMPPPPSEYGGAGMGTGMSMGMGMGMGMQGQVPPPGSTMGPPSGGMGMPMPPPPGGMTMPPPPSSAAAPQFFPVGGQQQQQVPPPMMQEPYAGQVYGAPPPNSMIGMPSAFGGLSSTNSFGSMPGLSNPSGVGMVDPQTGAPVTPGGAMGETPRESVTLPSLGELDLSIKCNPAFLRSSVGKIVNSQAAANASRLPIGIVCCPMAGDKGTSNDEIEVVDFGSTGIVRCRRCRTYINPFVSWIDTGRRWRCNLCGMQNDVPSSYFSHLDANGQRRDKDQRPELSKCSVEFVAPGEYMVRPPQPPVYFFVIDVSSNSAQSGMLQWCVNAIKASLDELPGSPRTQIGFITFDSSIHFYNIKSTLSSPQMHVVSDVSDIILPLPDDLLVNLQESRAVVESLLDSIPTMFRNSTVVNTCTGPAINAAKAVISHIGGKMLLFQSSLPSIGEGSLKPRDNPRMLGTDKEHTLLNAEVPFYKDQAIDCSRLQIAVDTFLFSPQYTDLATIAVLSKYTAGSTYYYPGFQGQRDGLKFEKELQHCLTRATAFEAVIRVRATRGLRITNFYGNYFIRGTDLLALPNCTSDSSFGLDIQYDEAVLSAGAITVQAALLYTSATGERRIRVHTMLIPVTPNITEMTNSVDIDCSVNLMAKQAVEISQKTGMDNARSRVGQAAVDIVRAATMGGGGGGGGMPGAPGYGQPYQQQQAETPLPPSLQLLPLYAMSLQKSLVLRGGNEMRTDERAFYQQLLLNMNVDESRVFIYPRIFSIHDMATDAGLPSDNVDDGTPVAGPLRVRLPGLLNLSCERLDTSGVFLLENGYEMIMWIGRGVNPAIIHTLFGVSTLEGVNTSTLSIQPDNSDFSSRAHAVIVALRQDRSRHMHLHIIREGDGYAEAYFARFLVEDRANFPGGALSYNEYYTHMLRQVKGLPG